MPDADYRLSHQLHRESIRHKIPAGQLFVSQLGISHLAIRFTSAGVAFLRFPFGLNRTAPKLGRSPIGGQTRFDLKGFQKGA